MHFIPYQGRGSMHFISYQGGGTMHFTFYLDEAPWQLDDCRPRSGLRAQHIIFQTLGANAAYHRLSQGLLSPKK